MRKIEQNTQTRRKPTAAEKKAKAPRERVCNMNGKQLKELREAFLALKPKFDQMTFDAGRIYLAVSTNIVRLERAWEPVQKAIDQMVEHLSPVDPETKQKNRNYFQWPADLEQKLNDQYRDLMAQPHTVTLRVIDVDKMKLGQNKWPLEIITQLQFHELLSGDIDSVDDDGGGYDADVADDDGLDDSLVEAG